MTDFIPQEAPFTGRKMLLIIVTFFGVIIAVNGTMLTFAVKTFGGLVVGNSYVASQRFNQDIAIAKAQPIRGWTLDVQTDETRVIVTVHDRDGSPLRDLDMTFNIARPTHDRSTLTVPMQETQSGRYEGKADLLPGQWRGTIFTGDGQTRSLTFTRKRPAP